MGMFNIYDEMAKTQASPQDTGMAYAKLSPGRGSVALAGQAGQMMSQGAMQGMGFQTPAQQRQANIMKVRDQFPNPTTTADFKALANALNSIGETDLAKQAIDQIYKSTQLSVAEKTLDIKDLEFNRKVNEPLVKQRWELEGKDNFARIYVAEKLRNIMSEADLKAFLPTVKASNVKIKLGMMLNKLKADGDISEDNAKLFKPTDFDKLLKSAKANYINQWQDKDVSADLFKETVDTSSDTDTSSKTIVPGEGGVGGGGNNKARPFIQWNNPNKGTVPAKDLPTDDFIGGA